MTKRYPFLLSLTSLIFSSFCLFANDTPSSQTPPSPPASANQNEIDAINAQIQAQTLELQKLRSDALTKEIDAQPLLFDNWEKFADKIQANEEDEKKILELKKEIDALKEKKSALEHTSQKR